MNKKEEKLLKKIEDLIVQGDSLDFLDKLEDIVREQRNSILNQQEAEILHLKETLKRKTEGGDEKLWLSAYKSNLIRINLLISNQSLE